MAKKENLKPSILLGVEILKMHILVQGGGCANMMDRVQRKEGVILQLSMTKPIPHIIEWQAAFQGKQHLMVTLGRKSYISDAIMIMEA